MNIFESIVSCGLRRDLRAHLLRSWLFRIDSCDQEKNQQECYELKWYYMILFESLTTDLVDSSLIKGYIKIKEELEERIRCRQSNLTTHDGG
jgi:hypothetical protein